MPRANLQKTINPFACVVVSLDERIVRRFDSSLARRRFHQILSIKTLQPTPSRVPSQMLESDFSGRSQTVLASPFGVAELDVRLHDAASGGSGNSVFCS